MKYLLWRGLIVILEIAAPFYTLLALSRLEVAAAQVGIFTLILSVSGTILNPVWGWLGDHKGFLIITILASTAGSIGALLAANANGLFLFYIVFLCVGTMISGLQISSLNIVYEFSPPAMIPTYTAASQIALVPLSMFAPLLGGHIVENLGYTTTFWIVGLVGVCGVFGLLTTVRIPKKIAVGTRSTSI